MGRRKAVLALRLVVTVGVLAILVPRIRLGSIDWDLNSAGWLAAGLIATLAGIVVSTMRWQRVLDVLGLPSRLWRLLSFYLAGQFVSSFLPSTVGGDVLRVTRLANDTGDRPGCFASVVLERLTGWLVLPLLTFAGFAINPGLRHAKGAAVHLAVTLAAGTLVLLATVLVLAAHPRMGGRLAERDSWLRFIGAVHLGIDRLRRRPLAITSVLLVGLVYQLIVVLTAFLAAKALDLNVSFTVFLTFFPAVAIAQVLPISIGGLGLREAALVIFLNKSGLGASYTQAIAVGVAFYAMNLAVSLLGAPSFALGPRAARAAA